MQTARNIAIIALLALAVAFVPGGGNVADALIAVITLAFFAAIGYAAVRLYNANRYTVWSMPDRDRALFFGGIGVLVLCLVALDRAFDNGASALVWFGAVGLACLAIFRAWTSARRFG